jgi:hypothetical protein
MGKEVSAERLRELFEVRDGVLYNRVARGKAKAGAVAGNRHNKGYLRVRVDGEYFLVHRVIFAMVHGYWPECVDHRVGGGLNNDPENLRAATHRQNMQNTRRKKNNITGAPGVSWCSARSKWAVFVGGKFFGRHADFELAELIAGEARHRLFGAFAPVLN